MSVTQAMGTSFSWNAVSIAELTVINGIELQMDTIDSTTFNAVDFYKTFVGGLIEAGELTVEGFFSYQDTTGQLAMLADFNSRTSRPAVIAFPAITGAVWTVPGLITKIKIGDVKVEGLVPFSASIKPIGKPNLTIATSAGMSAMLLSGSAVITPVFAIGTTDYVATVLTGVASITITPTSALSVLKVNGNVVASGQASSAIMLGAAGSVTNITVEATEPNKAPKTYTVKVVRA